MGNRLASLFVSLLGLGLALSQPVEAQQRTLKVGSIAAGSPFAFQEAGGPWQGYLVDVLEEAARRAELTLEYAPAYIFADLPAALTGGQIDIIAANFSITDQRRALGIDWTMPIYVGGDGMLVPASDTAEHTSFNDFGGQIVGALTGTSHETWLRNNAATFSEVKSYATRDEMMAALASGEIKAARVAAGPYAYELNIRGNFPESRFVDSYVPIEPATMSFAFRQSDTEVIAKLNTSLAAMKADGTLAAMAREWAVTLP
jgi:polar amino acid transport system substrate-binding protein